MVSKQKIIEQYGVASNGLHRDNSEIFLRMESEEKLFHLGSGESIFDFGCGSADLLVYYAPHFKALLGVDLSDNMIRLAQERIDRFSVKNVEVYQGDEVSSWERCNNRQFDVVTSAGVVQYLTEKQLTEFLHQATSHLENDGRIVLFDILDPRTYRLMKFGLYLENPMNLRDYARACVSSARVLVKSTLTKLGLREDMTGYTHHPGRVTQICKTLNLNVSLVRSMYYDYRYHAIISKS